MNSILADNCQVDNLDSNPAAFVKKNSRSCEKTDALEVAV